MVVKPSSRRSLRRWSVATALTWLSRCHSNTAKPCCCRISDGVAAAAPGEPPTSTSTTAADTRTLVIVVLCRIRPPISRLLLAWSDRQVTPAVEESTGIGGPTTKWQVSDCRYLSEGSMASLLDRPSAVSGASARYWMCQPVVGGPPCPCPPGPVLAGGPGSAGAPPPGGEWVVGGAETLGGEARPCPWASALRPAATSSQ
jgi:hypothetical protein